MSKNKYVVISVAMPKVDRCPCHPHQGLRRGQVNEQQCERDLSDEDDEGG